VPVARQPKASKTHPFWKREARVDEEVRGGEGSKEEGGVTRRKGKKEGKKGGKEKKGKREIDEERESGRNGIRGKAGNAETVKEENCKMSEEKRAWRQWGKNL